MDTITDLVVGVTGEDNIILADAGTETGVTGGKLTSTKTDTSLAASFLEALDLASVSTDGTNNHIAWFQYDGNTYLVQDSSASVTYDIATDSVIKITGLVDLLGGTNLAVTFA